MLPVTSDDVVTEYIDYPFDYPFDYDASMISRLISKTGVVGAEFRLIIFGPCTNPGVYVGDNLYQVNLTLETGEHVIIDSSERYVRKHKVGGEEVSCFNDRNREHFIFQPIPAGNHTVIRNGVFGIELTVLESRSEPEWWI